jgi:hypothetical protein
VVEEGGGGRMISKVTVTRISAVLFLGGLVALLIGLTLGPNMADADGKKRNCEELLADNTYSCSFRFTGGRENVSLDFSRWPTVIISEDTNSTVSFGECQCGAEGSFRRPRFGASSEFFCLVFSGTDSILTGEAKAKGIEDGQFLQFGNVTSSAVFQCVR